MNYYELAKLIKEEGPQQIRFTDKGINNPRAQLDVIYVAPGICGEITAVSLSTVDDDPIMVVHIDYSRYEKQNASFETQTYSKDGVMMSCREAGWYMPRDSFYVLADDEIHFEVLAPKRTLRDEYSKSTSQMSYTNWLEEKCYSLMAKENI